MSKQKSIKRDIRFRVYLAFTGICLFGAAIVIQAARIQAVEGHDLLVKAKDPQTRYKTDTLFAERGNIYTEDGILLKSSVPEFDIVVDLSVTNSDTFSKYIDTVSEGLANLLAQKSAEQYKSIFTRAYERNDPYQVVARKVNFENYEAIRKLPMLRYGRGNAVIYEERTEHRIAPYNNLASHTIGIFRGKNNTGLEGYYDSILTGTNGYREVQKATGVWLPVEGSETHPQNGKDIVTTLDMDIQTVAEDALLNVLQKENCAYGTCIVMEVKTGKIRALANLGKIDSLNGKPVDDIYRESYNYALVPTEPGSTFKLITLLSLLQDKYENINNKVDAQGGTIRFGGHDMKDSHKGLGEMPIWLAFAKSSNAAMSKLAFKHYKTNPAKFLKHLYDLRLDQPTGIDLKGNFPTNVRKFSRVTKGSKKVDSSWAPTTLPWMAIGYEVAISPLHTCMVYNAVANSGKMMKPYLVSAIRQYGKDEVQIQPTVLVEKIADSSTISQLQQCLRYVVTDGTAKGIESPYYTMCGKTGTAQVADKGITYADGVYQGSFVGYFPAEAPQYTVCVVIRTHAHANNYYGGAIAAPVFRMVADKLFAENMGAWKGPLDSLSQKGAPRFHAKLATGKNYKLLLNALHKGNVEIDEENESLMKLTSDSTRHLSVRPANIVRNVMPDLKGMGLRDAVYILESFGMKVIVKGKGKVQSQSVEPGVRLKKEQIITLQLS